MRDIFSGIYVLEGITSVRRMAVFGAARQEETYGEPPRRKRRMERAFIAKRRNFIFTPENGRFLALRQRNELL
jgi:hypothetical protein